MKNFMAYIIDIYNRWDQWDRQHSVHRFRINDNWYAIKEVELEWGKPKLPLRIGAYEGDMYEVYGSIEKAMEFVKQMRELN